MIQKISVNGRLEYPYWQDLGLSFYSDLYAENTIKMEDGFDFP